MAVISYISLAPESLFQGEHFKALEKQLNQTWVSDYRTNALSALFNSKGKLVSFLREWALEKKWSKENPNKEKEREYEEIDKRSVTCRLQIWGQTQCLTFDLTVHIPP